MSSRATTLTVFALIVIAGTLYVVWPTDTSAPTVTTPSPSATITPNPAIILSPSAGTTPSATGTPTPTAYNSLTTYADPAKRFKVGIPKDWSVREFRNQADESIGAILAKPTGETIQVMVKAAVLSPSLEDWLQNRDKESATAYEGQPSKKILTTRQTVVSGYPALERKEEWLAAGFTTVVTYVKAENNIYVIELLPQAELAASELRSIYEAVVGSLVIEKTK